MEKKKMSEEAKEIKWDICNSNSRNYLIKWRCCRSVVLILGNGGKDPWLAGGSWCLVIDCNLLA